MKVKSVSCVRLFATPWTATHQAPPSMGLSRQEYWSGVPLPRGLVNNMPCFMLTETLKSSLIPVPQDNVEKEMATTPVFLPGESRGWRSLVGCCPWGCTESDMTEVTYFACMHWRRKWQPTPIFLPGESQGQRSQVGCRLWGRTELDTTEATSQQQQDNVC